MACSADPWTLALAGGIAAVRASSRPLRSSWEWSRVTACHLFIPILDWSWPKIKGSFSWYAQSHGSCPKSFFPKLHTCTIFSAPDHACCSDRELTSQILIFSHCLQWDSPCDHIIIRLKEGGSKQKGGLGRYQESALSSPRFGLNASRNFSRRWSYTINRRGRQS